MGAYFQASYEDREMLIIVAWDSSEMLRSWTQAECRTWYDAILDPCVFTAANQMGSWAEVLFSTTAWVTDADFNLHVGSRSIPDTHVSKINLCHS